MLRFLVVMMGVWVTNPFNPSSQWMYCTSLTISPDETPQLVKWPQTFPWFSGRKLLSESVPTQGELLDLESLEWCATLVRSLKQAFEWPWCHLVSIFRWWDTSLILPSMCGCGTCRKTSILKCWSPHTPPVSVVCILSLVYERREKCCNRGNLGHEIIREETTDAAIAPTIESLPPRVALQRWVNQRGLIPFC